MGVLGILIGIVLVVVLTYRGLNVIVAAPISAIVVMLFNAMPLVPSFMDTFLGGSSGFVKNMLGIYVAGTVLGAVYSTSGAAKSIAVAIISIIRGKNTAKAVSPLAAIFIVFLAGMVLAYGGIHVVALIFVLLPLAVEVLKQARIPIKMVPGLVMGSIVTVALCSPGSPQSQNVLSMQYMGTSSTAALIPGLVGMVVVLVLNIGYLTWAAKREIGRSGDGGAADGAVEAISTQGLPNPVVSLIPLVVIFVLFNLFHWYIVYAITIGILLGMILFYRNIGGWRAFPKMVGEGANNACVVLIAGAVMGGFGAVVSAAPGFSPIAAGVSSFSGPPLLVAMLAFMIITGVCGSGPAGLGVAYPMFSETFLNMGVSAAALHRVGAFSAVTFDSLPTNALFLATTNLTGLSVKETYKHVGVCTVINTTIGTLVVTLLCIAFPALAV